MAKRPKNETTSPKIAKIASKALRTPGKVTRKEVQKLGGSALTQAQSKRKTR